MRKHLSTTISIFISLFTLLTTGFITSSSVKQVTTVEKRVAVVFMKLSPNCSSEAACEPDYPAGLRANIHSPRASAATYVSIMNQTMTSFITQATYSHTHMTFTAIQNPNSSDGWFSAPHPLEDYNDPAHNPDAENYFEDAVSLAFSAVGYDINNYDVLLVVNNIQSLFGYTMGCGSTAPGDYVTCTMSIPTPTGPVNKKLSLVHISENVDNDSMLEVLGHELGHVHNLYHVRMGPYDIVGDSNVLTHYGGWSKSRAGWVPEVTDLEQTGEITVALDPLEFPGHNVLRIPYLEYANSFAGYIVECRAKIGFDTKIPEEGVVVTYADTNYVEGIQGALEGRQAVIQFPEQDGDYNDAALQPGESYVNEPLHLTITYLNKDSSNRCVVKAMRGIIDAPDPMIAPYTQQDSGVGYIEYTSQDIWIDSQANGWNVYPAGQGLSSEGGQPRPTGYGDPFWVNHENRIKYRIKNTGYSDATNVSVDIYVTQPMLLYNECDHETSPNTESLLATQTISLLKKGGYYFGEVPWTPTSYGAAQVKVVIRDYMGEVTHSNNSASETYAAQNILTDTLGELQATELLGAFSTAKGISVKSSLKCGHLYNYNFTRKVISAIDRKYWVMDEGISQGALAPGEEEIISFSGTPPKDAKPGDCEEVLMEMQVQQDDFYIPVNGFTYRSCVVASSKLTCSTPPKAVAYGKDSVASFTLSPAKGGETIALDYVSPSGKHQILNGNLMSNGTFNSRFTANEPGKWKVQAYWQGSDTLAPAQSPVCEFEVSKPEAPVLEPTLIIKPPVLSLDICKLYTTQDACSRHKDTCKWVIRLTGAGACVKK